MRANACFAVFLMISQCLLGAAPAATAGPSIPLIVGLTVVRSISEPAGDYESLRIIRSVDAAGYELGYSAEVPDEGGGEPFKVKVTRRVRAADQADAHAMRLLFADGDPASFPGTTAGFSASQVDELRKSGKTRVNYHEVHSFLGMSKVAEMQGTLARVSSPTQIPMLVNGQRLQLPVLHVQGTLADDDDSEDADLLVLDDPANPILLSFKLGESEGKVTRIEYPVPTEAPSSMESTLAKREPALVYGIYFSFAKADIRPESERVLKEITGVLQAHPDWHLRIEGHTDNVGGSAANLELSRKRSAAVKAALVSRYNIDASRLNTNGYGDASPREKNDTLEHRALNRRVELRRE